MAVEKSKKVEKIFKGIVVSDKMSKTVVVAVKTIKAHAKYKKRYISTAKYKVHDEKNQYHEGDAVKFVACRPLSKEKKWRVLYRS